MAVGSISGQSQGVGVFEASAKMSVEVASHRIIWCGLALAAGYLALKYLIEDQVMKRILEEPNGDQIRQNKWGEWEEVNNQSQPQQGGQQCVA